MKLSKKKKIDFDKEIQGLEDKVKELKTLRMTELDSVYKGADRWAKILNLVSEIYSDVRAIKELTVSDIQRVDIFKNKFEEVRKKINEQTTI